MSTETQQTVYDWLTATFPGADPESPRTAIRVLEEVVELCLACGAKYRDIQFAVASALGKNLAATGIPGGLMDVPAGGTHEPAKVPSEAADVLVVLYGLAGLRGFDLHDGVDKKMKINRSRAWEAFGDGTGQHVAGAES